MNTYILAGAAFALGALAGGGGVYVILSRKYREDLAEETDALREHYYNGSDITRSMEAHPAGKGLTSNDNGTVATEPLKKQRSKEEYTTYSSIAASYSDEDDEDEGVLLPSDEEPENSTISYPDHDEPATMGYDPDAIVEDEEPRPLPGPDDIPSSVIMISEEEYLTNQIGFEQVELRYFELDDILCDDHDMALPNYEYLVSDWIDEANFGAHGAPKNMLYLRNMDRSVEMQITKVHGAFQEVILGIPFEPDDDSPRRMRAYHDD